MRTGYGLLQTRWAIRLLWAVLFVSHTPAWLGAFSGDDVSWLRLLLMTLTQAFFVLKVVDARWLRIPEDPQSILRFCVIVALLHAGVIQRNAEPVDRLLLADGVQIVLAAVALLAAAGGRRILRHYQSRVRSMQNYATALLQHVSERVGVFERAPRLQLHILSRTIDRAPPA